MALTLYQHLAQIPYKDLRGIATRLGLRKRNQGQKQEWIEPIVTGWQQAALQQQWLPMFSEHAKRALERLLQAEQMPATLFWAEYGPVRQVTARQKWSPPPWQEPATVSEELYYTPPQHRLTFSLLCKMLISGAAQYNNTAGAHSPTKHTCSLRSDSVESRQSPHNSSRAGVQNADCQKSWLPLQFAYRT